MVSYPLLGKFKEEKWQQQLRDNGTIKTLFDKLVGQALGKCIPLTSISGHEEIITMVAQLRDINDRFGKGETLLHWAASNKPAYALPTSKVLVLLLLGANPNTQDVLGRTPLHWAVNHSCSDIADDKDLRYDKQCRPEDIKVLNQLLSFHASPNIVDKYDATPLCHAIWSKRFDIVDILRPLTAEHLPSDPEFILTNTGCAKSIRCSKVDLWIQENTSDVNINKERLQSLLFCPGTGFLQHQEEVEIQKEQVLAFFRKISSNILKEDPLLEFSPRLAGSMAEGTKCQRPDEQDIILRLTKFESICAPEESEFAPHGVITLKFTGNDTEMKEYEKYILDGYLNREEILYSLLTKLEKEVSSTTLWSGEDLTNIYPSHDLTTELKQAIEVGDIGNLSFIWHGEHYKQIRLSIDVVPAIIIKNWRPDAVITKDPMGNDVPNETFLILRSFTEDFEYDIEMHGELDGYTDALQNDTSTLETLNGENWDSGSDCMSENGDGVNSKDSVNTVSGFHRTFMVGEIRNVAGLSIPKIERILRNVDADLNEINCNSGTDDATKRFKTAVANDANLYPVAGADTISESNGNEQGLFEADSSSEVEPVTGKVNQKYSNVADSIIQQMSDTDVIEFTSSVNMPQVDGDIRQENTCNVRKDKDNISEASVSGKESHDSASLCRDNTSENAYRATYFETARKNTSHNNEDDVSLEIKLRGVSSLNSEGEAEHSTFRFYPGKEEDEILFEFALPPEVKDDKEKNETVKTTSDKMESSKKLQEIMERIFGAEHETSKTIEDYNDAASYISSDDDSDKDHEEKDTDIDEESSEEPREDMGFKISYSKWETDTMASFPHCIKSAYILSKTLVSFIPEIRTPLNRGIHKNMKGYSAIKDFYSYLLKMALFSAVNKNINHVLLTIDSDIRSSNEDSEAVYSGNTVNLYDQVIYSRHSTGSPAIKEERKITMYSMHTSQLKQIAFWVNQIFSEVEASAGKGNLASYFDPKVNVLERISNAGKQKNEPYPSLLYLRKQCQIVKALVRIEEVKPEVF